MEHRWGKRVAVDIPIQITSAHPFIVRSGRLANLSVSGALISADVDLRFLSRIQVVFELPPRPRREAPMIDAYVARTHMEGFGVEWCEFSPPAVAELLSAMTVRPYAHIWRGKPLAPHGLTRLGAPLLKHGR